MKLQRISNIAPKDFIHEFIEENRPVVVADAIDRWGSNDIWNADYFTKAFGRSSVQIYDDLFTLETISTLDRYFNKYWRKDMPAEKHVPYVRWYAKFKPIEFCWSDDAFTALAAHWTLPYFLPDSEYVLPYCPQEKTITPVLDQFPGKGIFISAAGARTRLHKDPWASDAVLCQVCGEKRVLLYHPSKEPELKVGNRVVDVEKPDLSVFARFAEIEPDFTDVLKRGEILYIPAGWFHHVTSLSDSISITWNFVSMRRWPSFASHLLDPLSDEERAVLKYFASAADLRSQPAEAEICV